MRRAVIAIVLAAACGSPPKPAAVSGAAAGSVPAPVAVTSSTPKPTPLVVIGRAHGDVPPQSAEAIAALEAFLATHTDDPVHVPDALVRLGAMHLDLADAAWDGPAPEATASAATRKAVAILTRVVDEYPAYVRRDFAIYLLGYARQQDDDAVGALAAYQQVAALPSSAYATEAWFRIGDLHFDSHATALAVRAYQEVMARPASPFTAVARYKLGWSYYRNDQYAEALAAFQAVLDHDAHSALHAEAAQYVAICLTERDWDGDGRDDGTTVARVAAHLGDGSAAVRREIAELAGDLLHDEARDDEAAAVYRLVLATPIDLVTRARIADKRAKLSRD